MAEAAVIKNNGLGKIEGLCACYTKATLNVQALLSSFDRTLIESLPKEYYGYVYVTVIRDRQSYYIGQHKGVISLYEPDYWGSGIRIRNYIAKHGTSGLLVFPLAFASTQEQLDDLEELIVGDKYKEDPNCWNLRAGGMATGVSYSVSASISSSLSGLHHTEETKQKIRENSLTWWATVSEEEKLLRNKKTGDARRGKPHLSGAHWYNNGVIATKSDSCPEGFVPGMLKRLSPRSPISEEARRKVSLARKGRVCWTDGEQEVYSKSCPGPGWEKGTLRRLKGLLVTSDPFWYKRKVPIVEDGTPHYWTNGIHEVRSVLCPEGYHQGRIQFERSLGV